MSVINRIKILAIIITTLIYSGCDDLNQFELPEEDSIEDLTPPAALFELKQVSEDWRTVTITNLSTASLYYEWVLGDGTVLSSSYEDEITLTHTYDTDEITDYTVQLTASDALGQESVYTFSYTLTEIVTSSFEIVQSNDDLSGSWQTIFLTNSSSGGTTYLWDFGDGNTATTFAPVHTYNVDEETTYIISLTVTNVNGEEEVSTQVFDLEKPKPYLVPEVLDGDFELGDTNDYQDEDGNSVDDPIGDSRDPWRADFDRLTDETSVLQIANGGLSGSFSGKLPTIEDSNDYRFGYQEIEVTENINYRITYTYRIENDTVENGLFHFSVVTPLLSWDQLVSSIVATNVHEEFNVLNGTVTATLDFNSGSNTVLAILFYNEVEEVLIDNIELEGLD